MSDTLLDSWGQVDAEHYIWDVFERSCWNYLRKEADTTITSFAWRAFIEEEGVVFVRLDDIVKQAHDTL